MARNWELKAPALIELSPRCIVVGAGGWLLLGTLNQRVGGSSPPRPTISRTYAALFLRAAWCADLALNPVPEARCRSLRRSSRSIKSKASRAFERTSDFWSAAPGSSAPRRASGLFPEQVLQDLLIEREIGDESFQARVCVLELAPPARLMQLKAAVLVLRAIEGLLADAVPPAKVRWFSPRPPPPSGSRWICSSVKRFRRIAGPPRGHPSRADPHSPWTSFRGARRTADLRLLTTENTCRTPQAASASLSSGCVW